MGHEVTTRSRYHNKHVMVSTQTDHGENYWLLAMVSIQANNKITVSHVVTARTYQAKGIRIIIAIQYQFTNNYFNFDLEI